MLDKIFETVGFASFIQEGHLTAVKLHFGEKGNDAFIKPVLVRPIVEKIRECGAKPFLTDTNTLYYGSRHDSVEHLKTAITHGFDYAVVGAPVIIADGLLGDNWIPVPVGLKHFHEVKIAGDIQISDTMVVLSHFKGHGMSRFGGAIKNLAMGCAAAPGKIEQHQCAKPVITEECSGCGKCIESCPVSAILIRDQRAFIDEVICIGCNNCLANCPDSSMKFIRRPLCLSWKGWLSMPMERLKTSKEKWATSISSWTSPLTVTARLSATRQLSPISVFWLHTIQLQ
jgi:uncharacterized Fe-S center protein